MPDDPAESRPTVRSEVDGGIATITLDRPDALNALTIPMKTELLAAFRVDRPGPAVRAVVLTGAGRAFCAGQDLKERLEPDATPLAVELRERYNPIIRAMRALPQPIVGAINGVAAGAGASLAFACDLRLAAEGASFVLAFGRIGLVPDSGATWFLPRLVGTGQGRGAGTARVDVVGRGRGAVRARRSGRARRMQLAAEARAAAARLAELAPLALAHTKRALERSWSVGLDDALDDEAYRQGIAGASADHAEGLAAFVEKRPPRFTGE